MAWGCQGPILRNLAAGALMIGAAACTQGVGAGGSASGVVPTRVATVAMVSPFCATASPRGPKSQNGLRSLSLMMLKTPHLRRKFPSLSKT